MSNDTFEKLEQINAQVDVWIDEEDYKKVIRALKIGNKQLEDCLKICFEHNDHCTNVKEVSKAWEQALNEKLWSRDSKDIILPIKKVYDVGLDVNVEIDWYWSRLFYAKLLRARIQQRGTDCYFRRLDDVVAYLERHLPQAGGDATKLAVIYLLELSAASQSWEILAFAERARRVMRNYRGENAENFKYFYDLLARYNIGIAYFHEASYRAAVLEFNWIIRQVEQLRKGENGKTDGEEPDKKAVFFNKREGDKLLFLPAVIYRADIQLKLQLAYHALDTLDEYRNNFHNNMSHKKIRRDLIKAEAYQQMARLDRSSECLSKVCKKLFPEGSCGRESFPHKLGKKAGIWVPKILSGDARQNVKGRFLSIVIGHHRNYLNEMEGGWKQTRGEATAQWFNNNSTYLANLASAFITEYFDAVRYEAYDRRGYHEQLAEYLAWLAKVRDIGSAKQNRDALGVISEAAQRLWEKQSRYLLEAEPEDEEKRWKCLYCGPRGIDLRRLRSEHYDQFCKHMREFFKAHKQYVKKKGGFINRLIRLETTSKEDLRIRDLELRYELKDVLDQLPPRKGHSANDLCWKGLTDRTGFAGLLKCAGQKEEGKQDDHIPAEHYEHIIGQWDTAFLRHLEAPSSHEFQDNGFYFLGLQRWNSSSPAQGRSVGGGYLLYHTKKGCVDMGIAIDPGFDFVSNLFHMGFSLNDIDIVLISHAHIDHIRDFESIITLLYELQKRGKQDKRIQVILTLGIYRRLEYIIEDPTFRYFIEPYIIDINKETKPDYFEKLGNPELPGDPEFCFERIDKGHRVKRGIQQYRAVLPEEELNTRMYPWVKIRPTRAYHDDRSGYSDSFGFLVEVGLSKETGDKVLFGYTGDTKWVYPEIPDLLCQVRKERIIKDITEQYDNCDVLLVHLGSLIDKNNKGEWSFDYYNQCVEKTSGEERCEELVRRKDHPYLVGMLRLLSSLCHRLEVGEGKNEPLILLSEFGEELRGGIRVDLIHRLQDTYKRNLTLLPVDVGMNIQLWHEDSNRDKSSYKRGTNKVLCVQCNEFVPVEKADFELYGKDEALFCICKTCYRATPHNVLQDRLRQLYEVGHELRTVRRDST